MYIIWGVKQRDSKGHWKKEADKSFQCIYGVILTCQYEFVLIFQTEF